MKWKSLEDPSALSKLSGFTKLIMWRRVLKTWTSNSYQVIILQPFSWCGTCGSFVGDKPSSKKLIFTLHDPSVFKSVDVMNNIFTFLSTRSSRTIKVLSSKSCRNAWAFLLLRIDEVQGHRRDMVNKTIKQQKLFRVKFVCCSPSRFAIGSTAKFDTWEIVICSIKK